MPSPKAPANKVRAAATLDLAALINSATRATTIVYAYLNRAAALAWQDNNADTAARDAALASRTAIRVGRSTPAAKAEAITAHPDPTEMVNGFPAETIHARRMEHIVGSAIIDITDSNGDIAEGPVDQATMAALRIAIGERAWTSLRDFATGDTDDTALDSDFSQAPSGATPSSSESSEPLEPGA